MWGEYWDGIDLGQRRNLLKGNPDYCTPLEDG